MVCTSGFRQAAPNYLPAPLENPRRELIRDILRVGRELLAVDLFRCRPEDCVLPRLSVSAKSRFRMISLLRAAPSSGSSKISIRPTCAAQDNLRHIESPKGRRGIRKILDHCDLILSDLVDVLLMGWHS
jgi:hypothetical protein